MRAAAAFSLLALLSTIALVPSLPTEAADQAPPPAAAIPVAEVATRAAEVLSLLPALTAQLAPSAEIETIRKRLPALRGQIDLELAAMESILREQPTLPTLQAQEKQWQRRQLQANEWLSRLTERATHLHEALNRVADVRARWLLTRDAARASKAPGPILAQVDAVLGAVAAAAAPLEAQRVSVLDLQGNVSREAARSGTALAQIVQAQERAIGGMLARESPPIWSAETRAQARAELPARVRELAAVRWADIVRYSRDPSAGLPLHVGLFAVLAVVLWTARRRVHEWAAPADGASPATAVFDRPWAAAVAAALLLASESNSPAPDTLRRLFLILALVPVIRMTRPVIDPRLAPELYLLAVLFALDSLRHSLAGAPSLEQALLALEMLAGMAVLVYSLALGGLRRPSAQAAEAGRLAAFRVGAGLVLLVLAVALAAGAVGYMRLARLLASGVLISGVRALILYAWVRVLAGVAAFAFRTWPLHLLQVVKHHRDLLERRTNLALIWLAVGVWVVRSLEYVGLYEPAASFGATVLAEKLGRGSIQLSVGSILEFVLTVWLAYLVSAFIRFVLGEEVYPRLGVGRGISYAISSLLNYVIITLGFVLALGVLGLDLSKVTILASAFGVGIGFGLQSVVNNFVSGLILLFERPIHVGDTVEIGDLLGEVTRIGIRASTVHTWTGAEIVVPNAQLVTERVTNWTLSDRTRRIDLPVGVDYGSAPERVLEVLMSVARAHPQVLKDPAPQAIVVGFGDSSINFELRAWTNRFERWVTIKTELAVAVYAALRAAGMRFPFPQREVRLLGDPSAGPPR